MATLRTKNQIVMSSAIVRRKMLFITKRTFSILGMMSSGMSRLGSKFKILNTIVHSILINMMHNFIWSKKTTNMSFHYEPMFSNISLRVSKWVFWAQNKDISTSYNLPTFPIITFRTFPTRRVVTFSTHTSATSPFHISNTSIIDGSRTLGALFNDHYLIVN